MAPRPAAHFGQMDSLLFLFPRNSFLVPPLRQIPIPGLLFLRCLIPIFRDRLLKVTELVSSFPWRLAFSNNSSFSSFTLFLFYSYITSLPVHTFTNFAVLWLLLGLTENHESTALARSAL